MTITLKDMTRFLLPLDRAVDTIIEALKQANPGDTFVPKVPSSLIVDIAKALIGDRAIDIKYTGIRPGEKVHEILVSEEEGWRTFDLGQYLLIRSLLPELQKTRIDQQPILSEYSSADSLLSFEETCKMLKEYEMLIEQNFRTDGELLR